MTRINIEKELESEEYKSEWARHQYMVRSFLAALHFSFMDTSRDVQNSPKNFFLRVLDDYIQSIIAIELLAKEGIRNQCRRECRYLLELAIKACYITQQNSTETYEAQIDLYEKLLKEPKITVIRDINLYFFEQPLSDKFKEDIGRFYGILSTYIHSTPKQLKEKLELALETRYIGFEGVQQLKDLNNELSQILSLILVLLFHSVPQYVVGDYLVQTNGRTVKFYFNRSKYISKIDERFDYKHERQPILNELAEERSLRIEF